jgi:hypothetical protein
VDAVAVTVLVVVGVADGLDDDEHPAAVARQVNAAAAMASRRAPECGERLIAEIPARENTGDALLAGGVGHAVQ